MKNCVIVSAARTAIGSFNGALATTSAIELGSTVIKAAIERAHLDPQQVEEVIMGNVLQAGLGQNPARQALLRSGLSDTVCGFTVNKVCGSGLKSVALAAQAIKAGQAQAIVAGGMENMSLAPYLLDAKARWGYRLGDGQLADVILRDGLICAEHGYHMGITAENVAKEYGISREMQDELALLSQQKAIAAIESGAFQAEIVPVSVQSRKKTLIFERDEFPKADSRAEGLAALRPAFDKAGTVTAGNASGINDGAAALVVMEESAALAAGLKPLARIKAWASGGVAPAMMGMGPVPATQKALQRSGLQLSD
ncbi:acetyl-CoA C-acyltransferase, partial [Citrobacter youngae]